MPDKPVIDSHNTGLLGDEDALVRQAQKNMVAFGPLFDYYAPRVYRYVLHRIGNVSDAEDVTSRTFTDALRGLGRYRPKRQGSFGGWLFTIARRRCVDLYRAPDSLPLSNFTLQDSSAGPVDEAITKDDQRRLEQILKELTDKEQELLRLRFAAELTYQQIGDVIGKSGAAAKMSLVRLITRMRTKWEENDE
ncbi:MAG: sigma-70 family RNA polymerase sigma factor [Deltaproteobacteria bacterium]|nr:sigma-70 family RNA polymerase sigma factor [Deltaproteobacteria bacterium]